MSDHPYDTLNEKEWDLINAVSSQTAKITLHQVWDSVPGTIPQYISDSIKKEIRTQSIWNYNLPMLGANMIGLQVTLIPNGTIEIQLRSAIGERFWYAILRPPFPPERLSLIYNDEKRSYE